MAGFGPLVWLLATVTAAGVLVVSVAVAVLLAGVMSLLAPVVPVTVTVPAVVGVPLIVHTMVALTASVVCGEVGLHVAVRPAGRPVTSQVALLATAVPLFLQVTVPPMYGWPTTAGGRFEMATLMSAVDVGVLTQAGSALGQLGAVPPVLKATLVTLAAVSGLLTVAVTVTVLLPPAGTLRPVQLMVWPVAVPLSLALT